MIRARTHKEDDVGVLYANILLDRELPEGYLEDWTAILAKSKDEEQSDYQTYVIFRLGTEWLALDTCLFKEIVESRTIHTVPHHSGRALMGLANIRGRLRVCVSLHQLLEVATDDEQAAPLYMVVLEEGEKRWVFPADEVEGIRRFKHTEIRDVPVTVSKSTANYLSGLVSIKKRSISLIDPELLIGALKRLTR